MSLRGFTRHLGSSSLWIKMVGLLLLGILALTLLVGAPSDKPAERATVEMILGLNILWVGVGGLLPLSLSQLRSVPVGWGKSQPNGDQCPLSASGEIAVVFTKELH
jgi:hypothetical protein